MRLKHDIHLSAFVINTQSINEFQRLGFQRDEFANNTRCEVTAYHGTYRGSASLPSDSLWSKLCGVLERDKSFIGGLEEESYDTDHIHYLYGVGKQTGLPLPRMQTIQPPPGVFKACDIHINVDLDWSEPQK